MTETSYPGISILVSPDGAEEIPWTLEDYGAVAIETRDDTTMSTSECGKVLLIAGFESKENRDRAASELSVRYSSLEIRSLEITDDGWSTGWRSFFKPVVLDTIQIITPWMTPDDPSLKTIVIDPGQAFGTGGHATTYLLMKMLEDRAKNERLPSTVFDVGIGSGVLSIGAVLLGADSAEGIDIEQEAIVATAENAERNGVAEQVSAYQSDASAVKGIWPLVLANIQLAVFLECAPAIGSIVAPGGELLVSGLLEEQVPQCIPLWPNFSVSETICKDGWAGLALKKNS